MRSKRNTQERYEFFRLFKKNVLTIKVYENFTWDEFSDLLNFLPRRLHQITIRKNYSPTVMELYKISKMYDIPMEDLLKKILIITKEDKLKTVDYHG